MVFVLVLVYALYRWGSGRQVVLGTAIVFVAVVLGITGDYTTWATWSARCVVVILPGGAGHLACGFCTTSRARELDQVRLREREQLARELHDTVAHHVSAMVVRAQAGRVVGAGDPAAALDALEVIEAEGSRTLAEMRADGRRAARAGGGRARPGARRRRHPAAGARPTDRRSTCSCRGDLDGARRRRSAQPSTGSRRSR